MAILPDVWHGYNAGASPRGEFWVEHGSAQYIFAGQYSRDGTYPGDDLFHALKSTDGGATWISVGTAAAQFVVGGFIVGGITCCRDGDTVYLVSIHDNAAEGGANVFNGVDVWTFNLTTDTWSGPTNSASPLPGPFGYGSPPATRCAIQLVRRGTGNFLLLYNGPYTSGYFGRVYACPFNGSTWGTPFILPGQTEAIAAFQLGRAGADSSGYVHVFFGGDNTSLGGMNVYSVSIAPDNSTGSVQDFGPDFQGQGDQIGDVIAYGTNGIAMAYEDRGGGTGSYGAIVLLYATGGTVNPTWSVGHILNSDAGTVACQDPYFSWQTKCIALATANNLLYCFWLVQDYFGNDINFPPNGRYYYSTAPISTPDTWSTPALILTQTNGDVCRSYQVFAYAGTTVIGIVGHGYNVDVSGNADAEVSDFTSIPIGAGSGVSLDCADPPSAEVGDDYSHDVVITGTAPPYLVGLVSGTLPPGLLLSGVGTISGVPTLAGTYSYTLQVVDSLGHTDDATCTITITDFVPPSVTIEVDCLVTPAPENAFALDCSDPPNAFPGAFYSHQLGAVNGIPPYTFAFIGGFLPPGLSMDGTGLISGTPTAKGEFTFVVHVVDSLGYGVDGSCHISVVMGAGCADSTSRGRVGIPYSNALQVFDTDPPYTFLLTGGALPPGLSLTPGGFIEGVPSTAGSYSFTFQVTDSIGDIAFAGCTIIIDAADNNCPPDCPCPPYCPPEETVVRLLPIDSVYEMDRFKPNWENEFGPPQVANMACRNLLSFWPVPDQAYQAYVDIVRNMPVPTIGSGDFLQIGREWVQAVLDLAQHLAMMKIGGQDFGTSLPLMKNMLRLAAVQSGRMTASSIYNKLVQELSILYEQEEARVKQGPGRVEAAQPNQTKSKFDV